MTKPTMTVVEAGELLGLGRSTAYDAAKTGAIPTLRVGRRLLVPTHKFREMLGFQDAHRPENDVQIATNASVDPTMRIAIIAAAEAFVRALKHGSNA